jgi:hypothetical protein
MGRFEDKINWRSLHEALELAGLLDKSITSLDLDILRLVMEKL